MNELTRAVFAVLAEEDVPFSVFSERVEQIAREQNDLYLLSQLKHLSGDEVVIDIKEDYDEFSEVATVELFVGQNKLRVATTLARFLEFGQ